VHNIDPVLVRIGEISLYYYGLAYALGFLGIHLWLRWRRERLGWNLEEVLDLSILFAVCVLVFGRAFEIFFYEWGYFRSHPRYLLSFWRGGMASHGVLLGAVVGVWLFGRMRKKDFLQIADEVVLPAAFFLGLGRIGNFINGQIIGSITAVPWAVKFPGVEGFRHPVALYESLKNFLIVPILLWVRRGGAPVRGVMLAHFILWYGFLRLFTDCFRRYGNAFLGIGTGQYFNFLMTAVGLALLVWFRRRAGEEGAPDSGPFEVPEEPVREVSPVGLNLKRVLYAAILLFSLAIPSSWSRGGFEYYRAGAARPPEAGEPGSSVDEHRSEEASKSN
jgi:phosphatidylglycerol:prolipoprotein diacylglycerol transferase